MWGGLALIAASLLTRGELGMADESQEDSVAPWDCEQGAPMQLYRDPETDEFAVFALDLDTGAYDLLFTIDYSGDVVAVGMLTVYEETYAMGAFDRQLCRFDDQARTCLEGELQGPDGEKPVAGAVLGTNYYYTFAQDDGDAIYTALGVDGDALAQSDQAPLVVSGDLIGGGALRDLAALTESTETEIVTDDLDDASYLFGIGPGLEVVVVRLDDRAEYPDRYAVVTASFDGAGETEQETTIFGAAFAYTASEPRVLFASNGGFGLFELQLPLLVPDACWNQIDQDVSEHSDCGESSASLVWLAPSDAIDQDSSPNDGFNCPSTTLLDNLDSADGPTATPPVSRGPTVSPMPTVAAASEPPSGEGGEETKEPTTKPTGNSEPTVSFETTASYSYSYHYDNYNNDYFSNDGYLDAYSYGSIPMPAPSGQPPSEPETTPEPTYVPSPMPTPRGQPPSAPESAPEPSPSYEPSAIPTLSGQPTSEPTSYVPTVVPDAAAPGACLTADCCTQSSCWDEATDEIETTRCDSYSEPLRIRPVDGAYWTSLLITESGTYDNLVDIEFSATVIEAVGMFDDVDNDRFLQIGAVDGSLCRFDNARIHCYDGELAVSAPDAGAVLGTAYFYAEGLGMSDAAIFVATDIHTEEPNFPSDANFRVAPSLLTGEVGDIAAFKEFEDEDLYVTDSVDGATYVVGLSPYFEVLVARMSLETMIPVAYAVLDSAVPGYGEDEDPPTSETRFGGAFAYGGFAESEPEERRDLRIFFADDSGLGLFELLTPLVVPESCWYSDNDVDDHELCAEGTASLVWRAQAEAIDTSQNDGFNCPEATFYDSYTDTLLSGAPTPRPPTMPPTTYQPTTAPVPVPTIAPVPESTTAPAPGPTSPQTLEGSCPNDGFLFFDLGESAAITLVETAPDGTDIQGSGVALENGEFCMTEGCYALRGTNIDVIVHDQGDETFSFRCTSTDGSCRLRFCVEDGTIINQPTAKPTNFPTAMPSPAPTPLEFSTSSPTDSPTPVPSPVPSADSSSTQTKSGVVETAIVFDFGSTSVTDEWETSIGNAVVASAASLRDGSTSVAFSPSTQGTSSRRLQASTELRADITAAGVFSPDSDEEAARVTVVAELFEAIDSGALGREISEQATGTLAQIDEATLVDSVVVNASKTLVSNVTTVLFTTPSSAPTAVPTFVPTPAPTPMAPPTIPAPSAPSLVLPTLAPTSAEPSQPIAPTSTEPVQPMLAPTRAGLTPTLAGPVASPTTPTSSPVDATVPGSAPSVRPTSGPLPGSTVQPSTRQSSPTVSPPNGGGGGGGGGGDSGPSAALVAIIIVLILLLMCIVVGSIVYWRNDRNRRMEKRAKRWRQLENEFNSEMVSMDNVEAADDKNPHPAFQSQFNALMSQSQSQRSMTQADGGKESERYDDSAWPSAEDNTALRSDFVERGETNPVRGGAQTFVSTGLPRLGGSGDDDDDPTVAQDMDATMDMDETDDADYERDAGLHRTQYV